MKRHWFPIMVDPPVDFCRREIRMAPEWLAASLLNTFVIGFGIVMLLAVLP